MTNDQHPKHNGGSKDHANHDHDDHDHHGHGDHKEKHTHGEHSHHDHHAMMVEDYKFRFWWVLALTVPILALSPMIQDFLGVDWRFTGDLWILLGLSDRKSTRLNSSHVAISYAVFCLKKKKTQR